MTLLQPTQALARLARVEVVDDDVGIRRAAVELIREALCRWGAAPRADLRRYLREVWSALGLQLPDVNGVLDDMELLGEVVQLKAAVGVVVLPRSATRVQVGTECICLGIPAVPGSRPSLRGLCRASEQQLAAHVRWSRALDDHEEPVISLEAWLEDTLAFILDQGAALEVGSPAQNQAALRSLWQLLEARLDREGGPASRENAVQVISRAGGAFWSSPGALADGVWPGKRPVEGDRFLPTLVRVDRGCAARLLTLPDWDSLWWAAWARSASAGGEGRVSCTERELGWSLPLPRALEARLSALSVSSGRSTWTLRFASADVAAAAASAARSILGVG